VSYLLTFVIALTLPVAAQAQTTDTPANPIAVIKVEGAIDRPLMGYLHAQIDQAVADNAVIVLQLGLVLVWLLAEPKKA